MITIAISTVTVDVEKREVQGIAFLLLVGITLISHDRNLRNVAHVVTNSICLQQVVKGSKVGYCFYELFRALEVKEAHTNTISAATHDG